MNEVQEWLLFHADGIIFWTVVSIPSGMMFGLGHEVQKYIMKSLTGESWYKSDSTIDRLIKRFKK